MFTCRIAAALSLLATLAPAEEPMTKLPPEGAWVRYHGVTKPDDGPEVTYKLTIKFLGREERNGQPCRWIELEETDDQQQRVQGTEYLIPEKVLLKSERPLDEAMRVIFRDHEGQTVSESAEYIGFGGADMLFLPGTRKNNKPVAQQQIVDYQSGRLTIPTGERGEYVWTRKNGSMTWEYQLWFDPKVPLGLARKTMQLARKVDGANIRSYTMDQYLEDFGLDAKSAFTK